MTPVWALARSELRRRWRGLLVLGLVAGLTGAAAVGAATGARRNATAYGRFAAATGPPDLLVRTPVLAPQLDQIAELPEVERSWRFRTAIGQTTEPPVGYHAIFAGPRRPDDLFQPLVKEGRLPDEAEPYEVALSEPFADALGYRLGSTISLRLLTQDEFLAFDEGFGVADGPAVELQVVAIVNLAGGRTDNALGILGTAAFHERHRATSGLDNVALRLRDDVVEESFADEVRGLFQPAPSGTSAAFSPVEVVSLDEEARAVEAASAVAVRGLLLFAAIALVAGVAVLYQASARDLARNAPHQSVLSAVGLTGRQRLAVLLAPAAPVVGAVALVVTIAGAVVGSSFTPIGSARDFEPNAGTALNAAAVLPGAAAIVILAFACLWLSGRRVVARAGATRRTPAVRPSVTVQRLATLGARPAIVAGGRFALEPGSGRTAVPTRSALLGAVLGIAGVVAAGGVGVSLDRLLKEPARYGAPGHLSVIDAPDDIVEELAADPDVDALLDITSSSVSIDGREVDAIAAQPRKGTIAVPIVEGRAPTSPDEIALGPLILSALDKEVGDQVAIDIAGEPREAIIVGAVLTTAIVADRYADSALLTPDGFERAALTSGFRQATVRWNPGVDVDAAAAQLGAELELDYPQGPPRAIIDLGQVRRLPTLLAGFLAILGAAAVAHATIVAGSRRARDIGVLRALGFTPRQAATTLLIMALTTMALGLAAGVPLGLVVGNVAWQAIAASVHVATDLKQPSLVILLAIPASAAVAAAVALLPAWRAAKLRADVVLRGE